MSLHFAKARMIEPASEHQMSVEPPLSRRHLRERHPHLESNPRLFRENPDWTNGANERDHRVEEFSNLRAFPSEMILQRMACAGMRLVPVREHATAFPAAPQRRQFTSA